MADLDLLNFYSEHPIDNIVYLSEESLTIATGNYNVFSYPHGLSFAPLPLGEYSTVSSFNTSQSLGTPTGQEFTNAIWADDTNTYVEIDNFNNPNNLTLYLRLYGFMPSNIDADVEPTAISSNNIFQFHSKYNLDKVAFQGVQDGTDGQTETIPHNLGYVPKARVWHLDFGGNIAPIVSTFAGGGMLDDFVTVDDTNLYLHCHQFGGTTFYYKIYYDL